MSSNAEIDEHRWMTQIREMLEEEAENTNEDTQTSVFNVPNSLRSINPDSYTPQIVALGPYHRNRSHLFEMERNKLVLAKKTQKQLLDTHNFQNLVDHISFLDSKIRKCYQNHLPFSTQMLSWMMVIDAAFLLHFLHTYTANSSTDNAIFKDIWMLENQIPLLVLRKIMEVEFQSLQVVDDSLHHMLVGLSKHVSPFEITDDKEQSHRIQASESAHVLDFLYRVVVPKLELDESEVIHDFKHEQSRLLEVLSRLKKGISWLLLWRPMKVILALPLIAFCHLPALAIIKEPVESLFKDSKIDINDRFNALPLVEEIMIPSVVELSKSGIIFVPTKDGIRGIDFDTKTNEFWLPIVTLDVNSEVILRNLVAYEALSSFGPLVLARYTELMNGIIDTEEDAKLLRENGIIINHLKSDDEVARLWNGMSKSLKLTKVSYLDRVIEDLNTYYDRCWRVKFRKFMEVYVFSSWQVLTFLAAILFLFLMILQVFSSVFGSSTSRRFARPN